MRKPITHKRAMELLTAAEVYMPAVVPGIAAGGFYVMSGLRVLGHGETIDEAMQDVLPKLPAPYPPFIPFRSQGRNVMRAEQTICLAQSSAMADWIRNALNLYHPKDRRK